MEIKEFNALKKSDEIEHYECQNGVSFWQCGTVIERDKKNKAFILVNWDNGKTRDGANVLNTTNTFIEKWNEN